MTHSIEFLKKAREVGATHILKKDYTMFRVRESGRVEQMTSSGWLFSLVSIQELGYNIFLEIDFTPLDDYYADKQLDINVTGISE